MAAVIGREGRPDITASLHDQVHSLSLYMLYHNDLSRVCPVQVINTWHGYLCQLANSSKPHLGL